VLKRCCDSSAFIWASWCTLATQFFWPVPRARMFACPPYYVAVVTFVQLAIQVMCFIDAAIAAMSEAMVVTTFVRCVSQLTKSSFS
jgi:hypothetical protein